MRRKIGWSDRTNYKALPDSRELREDAKGVGLLITGLKEARLFEHRARNKRVTVYSSERWLKPRKIWGLWISGILKLLSPSYRREALRIVELLNTPYFYALPIGVHAVRDMARITGILHRNWLCLFAQPRLVFEACAGGRVLTVEEARAYGIMQDKEESSLRENGFAVVPCERWPRSASSKCAMLGLPNMRLGGYYVAQGSQKRASHDEDLPRYRLLWVGRYLNCKCVPTIIRAFRKVLDSNPDAALLLVGEGAEREMCIRLGGALAVLVENPAWLPGKITFSPFVHNDIVRGLMRNATLYIMASNAIEGWGAVVPEAVIESCPVVSSIEVGSAATILPPDHLFHAGDVDTLTNLMLKVNGGGVAVRINDWSGEMAAKTILSLGNGGK